MTAAGAPDDHSEALAEAMRAARAAAKPLVIVGANSKAFYGRAIRGDPLEVGMHRGIVDYEPTELVLTARAGTPLTEIESTLAAGGQMLPFDPPQFGGGATFGGAVASGLSGPRRPYAGAVRDFVLGIRLLDGNGEILSFGGRVMKNVAGYDISRLMAGSLGTLGVLLEVSVKVLPRPVAESTLAFERDAAQSIEAMNRWAARPLPISAACHLEGMLYLRLSGTEAGVTSAEQALGGETVDAPGLWNGIRDQTHRFFAGDEPLWRLSVPPAAPPLDLPGPCLHDWGGAQRWLRSSAEPARLRFAAEHADGHATLFRGGDRTGEVFHPLAPAMMTLHRRLKASFDPAGILNPGKMYAEL